MLYPLRQGARLDAREKQLIALPLYVSWILSIVGMFRLSSSVRNPAYEIVRQAYAGPALPAWAMALGLGALAASMLGVWIVARARRARGVPLPWPTYAVLSAQSPGSRSRSTTPSSTSRWSRCSTACSTWRSPAGTPRASRERASRWRFVGYLLTVLVLGFMIKPLPVHDGDRPGRGTRAPVDGRAGELREPAPLPARRTHLAPARTPRRPVDDRVTRGLTFSQLTAGLLFGALAVCACLMPAHSDTYWHLRAGQEIWRTLHVPLVEHYSYTAARPVLAKPRMVVGGVFVRALSRGRHAPLRAGMRGVGDGGPGDRLSTDGRRDGHAVLADVAGVPAHLRDLGPPPADRHLVHVGGAGLSSGRRTPSAAAAAVSRLGERARWRRCGRSAPGRRDGGGPGACQAGGRRRRAAGTLTSVS